MWKDGSRYEGEWKNNLLHGIGIESWADGSHYEGQYRDDLKHGKGKISWADGFRYEGKWKNDHPHGLGIKTLPDGKIFEGKFKNGKAHGYGYLKSSEGEIINKGIWKENIAPNARGKWAAPPENNHDGKMPLIPIQNRFTGEVITMPHLPLNSPGVIRAVKTIDQETGKEINVVANRGFLNLPTNYKEGEDWPGTVTWQTEMGSDIPQAKIDFPDQTYYRGAVDGITPHGLGSYHMMNDIIISGNWEHGRVINGSIYMDNIEFQGEIIEGKPSIEGKLFGFETANPHEMLEYIRNEMGKYPFDGSDIYDKWQVNIIHYIERLNVDFHKQNLEELFYGEESITREYKSSVWTTYNNQNGEPVDSKQKNFKTEDSIIKTIAGFLNSRGGTLLIGVQDRPKRRIIGIEADFSFSGGEKDSESFQNSLISLITNSMGDTSVMNFIDIEILNFENKKICKIDVEKRRDSWTWVNTKTTNKGNPEKEVFYVRTGPKTEKLSPKQASSWRKSKV